MEKKLIKYCRQYTQEDWVSSVERFLQIKF
jgi:hypothetical protein